MAVDPRFGNSSGYFKDPSNGEDLTIDTPRVIPCELKDGKFVWPQVAAADGSQLLKIVYKLFTDEEKDLYKQYRGRSSSGEPRPKREHKEKQVKEETYEEPVRNYNPDDESFDKPDFNLVKFDAGSAVSAETAALIESCDRCLGCSQIAGLTYALLIKDNSNEVFHVPRGIIPDMVFERLCGGN